MNKSKSILAWLAILCTSSLTSCLMYGPSAISVPLFDEKGESQLTVGSNLFNGAEVVYDKAIRDKVYVSGNAAYGTLKSSQNPRFHGVNLGGDIGLYGGENAFKYSVHSGLRLGYISLGNENIILSPNIGGDIGLRGKFVEGALSSRMSWYNFSEIERWNDNLDQWSALESAVTLRFGKKVKFQTQIGVAYPLGDSNNLFYIFNNGLTFRF